MMIFKFFEQYILIKVSGAECNRFFNLCKNRKIKLWDISFNNTCDYLMKIDRKDFFRLIDINRKCDVTIRVERKHDLLYLLKKYNKNTSISLGIIIALVFMLCITRYIWNISFCGGYIYDKSDVIKLLRENNVYEGVRIDKIDTYGLEKKIKEEFSSLTWVSVSINGTSLEVKVKEADVLNDDYKLNKNNENETDNSYFQENENNMSNIVANYDGEITSIITRAGLALVKSGDSVIVGDELVLATITVNSEYEEFLYDYQVIPDSDIYIHTNIARKTELNKYYKKNSLTGKCTKKLIFEAGNKEISLNWGIGKYKESFDVSQFNQLHIGELYLPFFYYVNGRYEIKVVEDEYEEEEALDYLMIKCKRFLELLSENQVQIRDYRVNIEDEGDKYILYIDMDVDVPNNYIIPEIN